MCVQCVDRAPHDADRSDLGKIWATQEFAETNQIWSRKQRSRVCIPDEVDRVGVSVFEFFFCNSSMVERLANCS